MYDCLCFCSCFGAGAGFEAILNISEPDIMDKLRKRRLSIRDSSDKASIRNAKGMRAKKSVVIFMIQMFLSG